MLDTRSFPGMNPINHPARMSMLHRVTNFLEAWGKLPKYFTPLHLTVAELHVIIVEHLGIGNTSWKERPTSNLAAAAAAAVHCLQQYILPLTPVPSLFNLRIYLHRDSQKRIANL